MIPKPIESGGRGLALWERREQILPQCTAGTMGQSVMLPGYNIGPGQDGDVSNGTRLSRKLATLDHLGGGESCVPPWPEREENLRPSGPSHWLSRREALERWGEELFSVSFVPGSRWCEANLHAAWYLWRIPFPSVVSRRVEAFLLLNFDCVPGRCYFIPRLSPLTRKIKVHHRVAWRDLDRLTRLCLSATLSALDRAAVSSKCPPSCSVSRPSRRHSPSSSLLAKLPRGPGATLILSTFAATGSTSTSKMKWPAW